MPTVISGTEGVNRIQDGTVATADLAFNPFGFKNRIINGAMEINQRKNTSFSFADITSFKYLSDRFFLFNGDATSGTVDRVEQAPEGFTFSIKNNTDTQTVIGSNVELTKDGDAGQFFVGSQWVLSFWVRGLDATSGLLSGSFQDDSTGTNSVNDFVDEPYSVTTEWVKISYPFTVSVSPVSTNKCYQIEIKLPSGAQITGIQLEEGTEATPFERRPYGLELSLCQPYFERIVVSRFANGYVASSTTARFKFDYLQKRVIPTVSFNNDFNLAYRNILSGNVTPISAASIQGALISVVTTDLTAGEAIQLRANSPDSSIDVDAEL